MILRELRSLTMSPSSYYVVRVPDGVEVNLGGAYTLELTPGDWDDLKTRVDNAMQGKGLW